MKMGDDYLDCELSDFVSANRSSGLINEGTNKHHQSIEYHE